MTNMWPEPQDEDRGGRRQLGVMTTDFLYNRHRVCDKYDITRWSRMVVLFELT